MWNFDAAHHLLIRGGRQRRLEPKSVAVLARLLESPGVVVPKEELLRTAWPEQYVTEEVLTNTIYQLRKALDDDARNPRYIETIPKRGYRLLVDLPATTTPASRPSARRALARWAAVLLVALGLGATGLSWTDRPKSAPQPRDIQGLLARGWRVLDLMRSSGPSEAAVLARRAIELDPDSADAWALAATAWNSRAAVGDLAVAQEGYAAARRNAQRALELSPTHATALAARARARWLGSWDWAGAEADLLAALAVDPVSASLWTDFAELLLFSGRVDEARVVLRRALVLAPGSVRTGMAAGLVAKLDGDPEGAARHYRRILENHPRHVYAAQQLAKLERPPSGRSGGERLEALVAKDRVRPAHVALWYLESANDAAALVWLERAIDQKDPTVLFFRFDERWDRLRDHPRYRAAMAKAGIPAAA